MKLDFLIKGSGEVEKSGSIELTPRQRKLLGACGLTESGFLDAQAPGRGRVRTRSVETYIRNHGFNISSQCGQYVIKRKDESEGHGAQNTITIKK